MLVTGNLAEAVEWSVSARQEGAELMPYEERIFDRVLKRAIADGRIDLPAEIAVTNGKSLLRDIEALDPTGKQEWTFGLDFLRVIRRILPLLRPGVDNVSWDMLADQTFKTADIEHFSVECEGHRQVISFMNKYGSKPPRGLYLWGEPGTGKTHLMTVYARMFQEDLLTKSQVAIEDYIDNVVSESTEAWRTKLSFCRDSFRHARDGLDSLSRPEEVGGETKRSLESAMLSARNTVKRRYEDIAWAAYRRAGSESDLCPRDLVCISFRKLFELQKDPKGLDTVARLMQAKIFFLDDVAIQTREEAEFFGRVIETRTVLGKGVVFITSNFNWENFLRNDSFSFSPQVTQRYSSRMRPLCIEIRFQGVDYRAKKAEEENRAILGGL